MGLIDEISHKKNLTSTQPLLFFILKRLAVNELICASELSRGFTISRELRGIDFLSPIKKQIILTLLELDESISIILKAEMRTKTKAVLKREVLLGTQKLISKDCREHETPAKLEAHIQELHKLIADLLEISFDSSHLESIRTFLHTGLGMNAIHNTKLNNLVTLLITQMTHQHQILSAVTPKNETIAHAEIIESKDDNEDQDYEHINISTEEFKTDTEITDTSSSWFSVFKLW